MNALPNVQFLCQIVVVFLAVTGDSKPSLKGSDININRSVPPDTGEVSKSSPEASTWSDDEQDLLENSSKLLDHEDLRASNPVKDKMLNKTKPYPFEIAGLYQGDIYLPKQSPTRNANKAKSLKWPNATIPFRITADFSDKDKRIISQAMDIFQKKTCIRFTPHTSESYSIKIFKGKGCASFVGMEYPEQNLSLGTGCVDTGVILHELMHAAGFWHEQSRADRDKYVKINSKNIITDMDYNFDKYHLNEINHLGADYDICSIMHYSSHALSSNGQPTIEPLVDPPCEMGAAKGFSETDIRKLNTLYECDGYPKLAKQKCEDKNVHCKYYAKSLNLCESNASYMLENCAATCGQCPPQYSCDDEHEHCNYWAKQGECPRYEQFMRKYCPQACNFCSAPNACQDEKPSCSYWAQQGFCVEKHQAFMNVHCKKSCGYC
eukprot:TRINITY_DN12382_c0_g1_i1.p1 TRINITY_DN12382_c0_g1~~TRINITY_DN12382_c0_g1_i1.p1  ORF type:complete len:435 (+),score=35.42 TRINITY_DN12382_c0_g1_i1:1-1305(+)